MDFTVEGTWTRTPDAVTFRTGGDEQTWNYTFHDDGVLFTDPQTGDTFELFRAVQG